MGKTVVFTSAAVNYLPKVRKLCSSIRRHHPEWEIVLALADRRSEAIDFSDEPIDRVIALDDLDIADRHRWTYYHTIVELATAIKPYVLVELLKDPEVERVMYFDPDMVLFSRLDDLTAQIDRSDIALTPHLTKPEATLDGIRDNEISALKHGIYNLGFVGVRNTDEGRRFAQWWADRVHHFCVADIPGGLFTDQRWIDLVPAFFDGVNILKNTRYNVATWNIPTRELSGDGTQGFFVDGQPLGFYHFTGFDSGAHAAMAGKYGRGNKTLAELIGWYADEARFDDDEPAAKIAWAYGRYSDGSAIPATHRRLYRARPDVQQAFPDPFDARLRQWMEQQGAVEHPEFFRDSSTQTPARPHNVPMLGMRDILRALRMRLSRMLGG